MMDAQDSEHVAVFLLCSGVLVLTYRLPLYLIGDENDLPRNLLQTLVMGALGADALVLAGNAIAESEVLPPSVTSLLVLVPLGLVMGGCCCGVWLAASLLGVIFAALTWDLGTGCLLTEMPSDHASLLHAGLLTFCGVLFLVLFTCLSFEGLHMELAFPFLGAWLLLAGYEMRQGESVDEEPGASWSFAPSSFFSAAHPAPLGGGCPKRFAFDVGAFLAVALVGVFFQRAFLVLERKRAGGDQQGGGSNGMGGFNSMAEGLLTGEAKDAHSDQKKRFGFDGKELRTGSKVVEAICKKDPTGLSEQERRIYEICMTDEFERDRILFGGGLV